MAMFSFNKLNMDGLPCWLLSCLTVCVAMRWAASPFVSHSLFSSPTANPQCPQGLGVCPGLRARAAHAAQRLPGGHAEGVERGELHPYRRGQRSRQSDQRYLHQLQAHLHGVQVRGARLLTAGVWMHLWTRLWMWHMHRYYHYRGHHTPPSFSWLLQTQDTVVMLKILFIASVAEIDPWAPHCPPGGVV